MGDINYTQLVGKKTFQAKSGEHMKDVYLRACKWYATNVIANGGMKNVQAEFVKEDGWDAVTVMLYASLPAKDVMAQHCGCCHEMHHSFFVNEDTHCGRCSAAALQRRAQKKLEIKVKYCKETLKDVMG